MKADWNHRLEEGVQAGDLLEDSKKNILRLLDSSGTMARVKESVQELVDGGAWGELNDRFYRTLAFGTGGLRGRTIGKVVTKAEMGKPAALGRPEFPAVGTNCMN